MSVMSNKQQIAGLIGWIVVTFIASALAAISSVHADVFYATLTRPSWAPPGWIFGPVWIVLYTLMAIAAWLVWREGGFRQHRNALVLFIVQLVPNALWSWLFFYWHLGGWGLADIGLLWLLVVSTIVLFWRVRPLAGALLVPYLLWATFAAFLNYTVWQLNPQLLG